MQRIVNGDWQIVNFTAAEALRQNFTDDIRLLVFIHTWRMMRVRSPTVREGTSRNWPSLTLGLLTPIVFAHFSVTRLKPCE
jgi:hypothetical protein